jgi:hypothetical protein
MAIEWVRDNIASFGGASVDGYSFAWPSDPIVHALIPMSGTIYGIGVRTPSYAASLWYNATSALNSGDASTLPSQLLSCTHAALASSITAVLINAMSSTVLSRHSLSLKSPALPIVKPPLTPFLLVRPHPPEALHYRLMPAR